MRNIYRHKNGKGSVIEFNMYGKITKIFVPDTVYRPKERFAWSTHHDHIHELENFTQNVKYMPNSSGNYIDINKPLPKHVTDIQLRSNFPSFSTDKTAKENTDILMKYDTPAAHACREIDVGLGPMDLPNIYELMIIFQESDRLDALDPTFITNERSGLGCKSTYGRFNLHERGSIWSSTMYSDTMARTVNCYGDITINYRSNLFGIIPIIEV